MKRFKKEPSSSRRKSRRSKKRQRTRSDVRSVKISSLSRMTVALSTLRDSSQCLRVLKIKLLVRLI